MFGPGLGRAMAGWPVLKRSGPLAAGLGINVHHIHEGDLDRMRGIGVRYVRIDLFWDDVERRPAEYDWSEADRRIGAIADRGMRPIIILAYSNANYAARVKRSDGQMTIQAPHDPVSVRAFASWARAAAMRYRERNPIWEIWNEPEADGFWAPRADPQAYVRLGTAACRSIRDAVPSAEIWGPALGGAEKVPASRSRFLKAVLDSDLPACLSAISVHPYAFWGPLDESTRYWTGLRELRATTPRPFVASETGISNYGGWINANTQASYLVRLYIYNHMAGIPVTVWYSWQDNGANRARPDDNFGLLDHRGRGKPALLALEQFLTRTKGRTRQCLIQTDRDSILYLWNGSPTAARLAIAWNKSSGQANDTAEPVEIAWQGAVSSLSASDVFGRPAKVERPKGGVLRFVGGHAPYYVAFSGEVPPQCR